MSSSHDKILSFKEAVNKLEPWFKNMDGFEVFESFEQQKKW